MTRDEMIQKATAMLNERHAHAQRIGVEQIVDILASIGVVNIDEPPQCAPPANTHHGYHWLHYVGTEPELRGQSQVAKWDKDGWYMVGNSMKVYPAIAHQWGWMYGSVVPVDIATTTESFKR